MSRVSKWFVNVFGYALKGSRIYTNLPSDHAYYLELSEILMKRHLNLVFDPDMEKYADSLNVWFRVHVENDKAIIPVCNSIYRALLSLDMVRGK